MKKPHTKSTVRPPEYSGKSFNVWQRYIQRQVDKIMATNVADKYKVN